MSAPPPDSAETLDIIAVLYRRHRADLCRRAQSYVGSRDAAEDIVHEVFRRIVECANRIHSRLNSGYLHRAVRNEALHWIERRRVRLEWRTYVQHAMPFTAPTPADELRDRDRARVLSWAMKGLPPRGRQAFLLVYAEGRSYAEAAKSMGISPETLKVHLRRARRALRERLGRDSIID